ncbi:MAG: SLBB domain-containing protein [Acidobacteriota bacterium]|nr:SLBB domain-containing protein [Acidobacteriota bacterium]
MILCCLTLPLLAAADEKKGGEDKVFETAPAKTQKPPLPPETIEELNRSARGEYTLGPGDVIVIEVWDQPTLSGQHTVGPDGMITLPLVGPTRISDMTRGKAASHVKNELGQYYKDLSVNLRVLEYKNNRVFVLGHVTTPGQVNFEGRATLLEVLARAGSVPTSGLPAPLTNCAVIRGKEMIIWVNLDELLHKGNLRLNLDLANNDIVYIPYAHEPMIYVMGEVETPGAYRLTPGMSFLDGLMRAGGPTEDARKNYMALIRNRDGKPHIMRVRNRDFRKGDLSGNAALEENDIIYVSRKWIGDVNYVLRKLDPFISLLLVREAVIDD